MFRRNDGHLQEEMFTHYQGMNPKITKMLEKTWAPVFYEHVFSKINEEIFAPLYCADNGRPNFPVNIVLSLELIKNLFDYTDKEIMEQFYFNYQIIYALGIKNIGEVYLAERTLYEFRERLVNYIKDYPDQEDILFEQFESLTKHFIEVAKLKTEEQRTDSTLVTPNIKKAGRMSLAYDVLTKALKALPEKHLSESLKKVLEPSFKTEMLFNTKNTELESRLQQILALCTEVWQLAQAHDAIASLPEIQLLERFLTEQAFYDGEAKTWYAKDSKEVSSSSLQSANDPDATYRSKANKKHSGYVVNLVETCSEDNPVQMITDYDLDANNKSDIQLIERRLDKVRKNTDITDLYADGGYYSDSVVEKAKELDIKMHYTDMTGKKKSSDKLPLTAFEIDENYIVHKCPNNQQPLRSNYSEKSKATTTHFDLSVCKECPLEKQCPAKPEKKTMALRVSKKAIIAAQTREEMLEAEVYQENVSKRAAIEGTNSALKRSQGAGKLKVTGKVKCKLQIGLKIIGHNFKQLCRYIKDQFEKAKPPKGLVCLNPS